MTGLIFGSLAAVFIIAISTFLTFNPAFGGTATKEQKALYSKFNNYKNGKFINLIPTSMDMDFKNIVDVSIKFIRGGPDRSPRSTIPVQTIDSLEIADKPDGLTRLTWFGHSAFLLELDGKNILIDPMLGESPAPHPWLGTGRYSDQLPIKIEKMPKIDAVLISHDHYDHLDYKSILKLKDKTDAFYVPFGVGAHLAAWGISENKIFELNWWDEIKHKNFTFVAAPARHFSGRALFDRNSTLWSSWIILAETESIYFSGDGGYGPHFKEIGEKYGPFDIALMECGQYNERWEAIHMMPEQTVQATIDVKGKVLLPIHWGMFTLALHSWKDPIERVTAKASELGQPITTPIVGEPILISNKQFPNSGWWTHVD